MFLVTAVEDQGHARCELLRTPLWRSSHSGHSTKFVCWAFCEVRAATTALPNGASLFALFFVHLKGHRRAVPK